MVTLAAITRGFCYLAAQSSMLPGLWVNCRAHRNASLVYQPFGFIFPVCDRLVFAQENAEAFRAKALVNVDPKCLLYVQQREFAATTPADSK
uniref:Uncharacterized protein n=1 Tax=Anguilla anguilla TaxID=7936 RepID=A0A0E9UYB2_ANGAN